MPVMSSTYLIERYGMTIDLSKEGHTACPLSFSKNNTKHYLYSTYKNMMRRCYNIKDKRYDRYGGRGIKVCQSWNEYMGGCFLNFVEDMGPRPEGMSLDRIDNNGDYSKENCKWSTPHEQMINRSKTRVNKTGRIGISICPRTNKYRCRIKLKDKVLWLGRFQSYEEAVKVMEEAEIKHLGFIRE